VDRNSLAAKIAATESRLVNTIIERDSALQSLAQQDAHYAPLPRTPRARRPDERVTRSVLPWRARRARPGAPIGLYLAIVLASIAVYVFIGGVVHRATKENAEGMIGRVLAVRRAWLMGMALVSFVTRVRVASARVVERKDGKP